MPLRDLLIRGYFPKELPPPFNTRELAFLASGTEPRSWRKNSKGMISKPCELEHYSHKRVGNLRRRLSFPNPIAYYHLATEVATSWRQIRRYLSQGEWSATRPTRIRPKERSFSSPGTAKNRLIPAIARVRQSARYLLKADIARFYPSIYTHAIPWALHGKVAAKANRQVTGSLGNRLDYWLRTGQSGQTVGVPIGPDTSWVASELILVAVQLEFERRFQAKPPAVALIDDFELGFKTLPDAEQALADLEAALNHYELSLNPKKTAIHQLPYAIGSVWTEELATHRIRSSARNQATDLTRYFNRAFELARIHHEDHVLNYCLSRLRYVRVHSKNWELYQSLLIHCATVEPGSLPYVEYELRRKRAAGHTVDLDALSESLDLIIRTAAPLGHSAEVCWAVWLAIVFGAALSSESADAISEMHDTFAALTALHAERLGLFRSPLDYSVWQAYQNSAALWEDHWLLAYEANVKGWLSSAGSGDHVLSDTRFAELKGRSVEFYDARLAAAPTGIGHVPINPQGYPMAW
jgi:hypothetical protein